MKELPLPCKWIDLSASCGSEITSVLLHWHSKTGLFLYAFQRSLLGVPGHWTPVRQNPFNKLSRTFNLFCWLHDVVVFYP